MSYSLSLSSEAGKTVCWAGYISATQISLAQIEGQRKQAEDALRKSEVHFRNTFEYAPIGVVTVALDGRFMAVNQTFCDIVGYERKALLSLTVMDVTQDKNKTAHAQLIQQLGTSELTNIRMETQFLRKDRSLVWGSLSTRLVCHRDGSPDYFIATVENITERKQAETELRIAATVFESQTVGMTITDASTKILKVNQAFTRLMGYTEAEVLNQNPRLLHSGRHDRPFYDALWQTIRNSGVWQGEIWNKRKNGEIYPEFLTITAVRASQDDKITHYVATQIDITERKSAEEMIKQLAFYDYLTNLPNRRLLNLSFFWKKSAMMKTLPALPTRLPTA